MGKNKKSNWDMVIERFEKRCKILMMHEAGYSGQGHTSGAESFYGGYFGFGGDLQLAAKPIAIVRKIKKQNDEELGMNFKDQQERNRGYPAAVGFSGGDGGMGAGGKGVRIPNNINQIGKSAKQLDAEYKEDTTKNYWGGVPVEEENEKKVPYDGDEDLEEQAVGGMGGGPIRGGASDSAYRDLPGFPRMNALDNKRVFVPPIEGDYDGDGEEDNYLEDDEYVNDTLRLNGLSVNPETLTNIFYPDGVENKSSFSERTLYHGTVIDNLKSIKEIGLSGELGDFVKDSYGMELGDDELEGITFAAQKDELSSAVGAMRYNIGKKLGKYLTDVTEDDIKKYGLLVTIEDVDDVSDYDSSSWRQKPFKQEDEGYYEEYPPSVEPGDWFIQDGSAVEKFFTGEKLVKFLRRNGGLEDTTEDKKRRLIKMAVAVHGEKMRPQIIKKIKELPEHEIWKTLETYEKLSKETLDKHKEDRYAGKNQKHKGDQLKFDFYESKNTLKNIFREGGDYGSPGGSLGSGGPNGTERWKRGKNNMEPGADQLIDPIDYSGGHASAPAADQSNGGIGYGNIISPKDFVPEDWGQRNWKTKEMPVEVENLEKLEMGEAVIGNKNPIKERAAISSKKLAKKLNRNKKPGCDIVRQKGSHAFYKCGNCTTTIPMHGAKDIKTGTLHSIEKDLKNCLGDDWLEEVINRTVREVFDEDYTGIDDETGKGSARGGSEAFIKNRKKVLNYDKDQSPKGIKDLRKKRNK